ncbi:MAG: 23S rRNA (adenine(2503)-C(2))-methyltransferase RlmN [Syntrophorhabdaceae bacterium]|nr:23S rRNA (adenine(2503)-C(2))-methyltransferase RlmN [Syntrophorhabdaceae bacterium]
MKSFFGFTLPELEKAIGASGKEKYRARQLYRWVYNQGILDFDEMTNIPKSLRKIFKDTFSTDLLQVKEALVSKDGSKKFAFSAEDGHIIESVLIPEKDRNTLCVSTQVGCRMGCRFCVTGRMGFKRNLDVHEIVGQVVAVKEDLKKGSGERITNIVLMGMGEPVDNLDNVMPALDIIKNTLGLDFSYRRITISSVGLVEGLKTLEPKTAVIAISLNAADDGTRTSIMPINRLYSIGKIIQFVKAFKLPNRTRITFEYVLLRGVNDSLDDAKRLAELLKGVKCKINLIPYNESPYLEFKTPEPASIKRFHSYLLDRYFTTIIRDSRGQDICGGCGQLGMRYL